jgi:putative transposase
MVFKVWGTNCQKSEINRPTLNNVWHLDEMVIVIRGRRHFLWRAVDSEGEVLDFLVQPRRNTKAALKLMRNLFKKQEFAPSKIITDKLKPYHKAFRTLRLTAEHIDNKRSNNPLKIHICP